MDKPSEGMPPASVHIAGSATPEEVAAIVAVLVAASGSPADGIPAPSSGWNAHDRTIRGRVGHGQGAWRASGLPR